MDITTVRGEWALVTGASQGIGREFCEQLASRGINVFMVAREAPVLAEIQGTLEKKYGVKAMYHAMDLSVPHAAQELHRVVREKSVRIKLLCNNAAMGAWGEFVTREPEVYEAMTTLNTTTAVALARVFFEDLKAHSPSVLINVSSQAALQPVPYMAVYGATKAFMHSWSLALSEEWKPYGIHVQTLVPAPTKTAFDVRAGAYESGVMKRAEPSEIVSRSLNMLSSRALVVTNARGMYVQRIFGSAFPMSFVLKKVASMFKPPSE